MDEAFLNGVHGEGDSCGEQRRAKCRGAEPALSGLQSSRRRSAVATRTTWP
jgi:hypothetical protein